jgi:RNA polymerase sigma-70 factor (ECF subfamily)
MPELDAPADETLVQRVLAGDQDSFTELIRRYEVRIVNTLYRLVGQLDDAHDLAQEVFLRVYQALDRFDPQFRFSTWVFRIANNLAIDHLRRRRVRPLNMSLSPDVSGDEDLPPLELVDERADPGAELERNQAGQLLRRLLTRLPWEYRELLVLRHYGELAYEEIARLKGMPLGTVKNKLFRARQMLRGMLEAEKQKESSRGRVP